jgi:hypothetical protein
MHCIKSIKESRGGYLFILCIQHLSCSFCVYNICIVQSVYTTFVLFILCIQHLSCSICVYNICLVHSVYTTFVLFILCIQHLSCSFCVYNICLVHSVYTTFVLFILCIQHLSFQIWGSMIPFLYLYLGLQICFLPGFIYIFCLFYFLYPI